MNVRKEIEIVISLTVEGDEDELDYAESSILEELHHEAQYGIPYEVVSVDSDVSRSDTTEMQCPRCNDWDYYNSFDQIGDYGEEGVESDEKFCSSCIETYRALVLEEMNSVFNKAKRLFVEGGRW